MSSEYFGVYNGVIILAEIGHCNEKISKAVQNYSVNYPSGSLPKDEEFRVLYKAGYLFVGTNQYKDDLDKLSDSFVNLYGELERSLIKNPKPLPYSHQKFIKQSSISLAPTFSQIKETKETLALNITKLLERQTDLGDLEDESEMLLSRAEEFRNQCGQARKRMWWRGVKGISMAMGLVIGIFLFILYMHH